MLIVLAVLVPFIIQFNTCALNFRSPSAVIKGRPIGPAEPVPLGPLDISRDCWQSRCCAARLLMRVARDLLRQGVERNNWGFRMLIRQQTLAVGVQFGDTVNRRFTA